MKKNNFLYKHILCTAVVIVCPILITSVCLYLWNMLPGQEKALVYGDYLHEYLPFFKHFWDAFFHGKSLEYSFSLGMGSPTLAMYSIFILSPFSIIPYLISDIFVAGYITLMLKISVIALSMYFFLLRDIKSRPGTAMLFSMFYSLSSYVLIWHINIHFLDCLYVLPILIHFIVLYVKSNRSIGLVVSYTFCFINNFFMGYCIGFFSFIVYITLLWYFGIRGERLKKSLLNYFFLVVIAGLLSSPVILPAVMFVMQHMREGSDFIVVEPHSWLYLVNSLMFGRNILTIFETMPAVYCGWPVIMLTVAFFAEKSIKKEKILAVFPLLFLLVCIFWRPAYIFMHMFNEPDSFPWRFSFILIFLLICIAAYEYEHMNKKFLSVKHFLAFILPVFCIFCSFILNYFSLVYGNIISENIFLLNLLFIVLHFAGNGRTWAMYILSFVEMFCAVYLQMPHWDVVQEDILNYQSETEEFVDSLDLESNEFSRSSFINIFSQNTSLLYDYPGMEYFCSFDNNTLTTACKLLGLYARPQQYMNYGATEFTNMIFSVKNYGAYIQLDNNAYKFTNSPVLPLAFSVSDDIKRIEITDNPFDNQELLADSMTVNDKKLYEPIELKMEAEDGIEFTEDGSGVYSFKKIGENSRVEWYAEEENTTPIYAFISSGIRASGMFDQEKIVSGYPLRVNNPLTIPILSKLYIEEGKEHPAVYLSMQGDNGSEATISTVIGNKINLEAVQEIYDELSPLGLEIDNFRDDRIHGTVITDETHTVLFSSIPYDINWHIKIDGKECDTYAVFNGTFLACDIEPGVHEVEYYYKDAGFRIGLGAFAVGLLLLLMQIQKTKAIVRKPESENETVTDHIPYPDAEDCDEIMLNEEKSDDVQE